MHRRQQPYATPTWVLEIRFKRMQAQRAQERAQEEAIRRAKAQSCIANLLMNLSRANTLFHSTDGSVNEPFFVTPTIKLVIASYAWGKGQYPQADHHTLGQHIKAYDGTKDGKRLLIDCAIKANPGQFRGNSLFFADNPGIRNTVISSRNLQKLKPMQLQRAITHFRSRYGQKIGAYRKLSRRCNERQDQLDLLQPKLLIVYFNEENKSPFQQAMRILCILKEARLAVLNSHRQTDKGWIGWFTALFARLGTRSRVERILSDEIGELQDVIDCPNSMRDSVYALR